MLMCSIYIFDLVDFAFAMLFIGFLICVNLLSIFKYLILIYMYRCGVKASRALRKLRTLSADPSSQDHWEHCYRWWQTNAGSLRCWSIASVSSPSYPFQEQFAEGGSLDLVEYHCWQPWPNSGCHWHGIGALSCWRYAQGMVVASNSIHIHFKI